VPDFGKQPYLRQPFKKNEAGKILFGQNFKIRIYKKLNSELLSFLDFGFVNRLVWLLFIKMLPAGENYFLLLRGF